MNDDLFSYLYNVYDIWRATGRVTIGGLQVALALPTNQAVDGSPSVMFVMFVREYMRLNPVVGTGIAPNGLGLSVTLRDRTNLLFVKTNASAPPATPSWNVSKSYPGGYDALPPTFEMPIMASNNGLQGLQPVPPQP